MEVTPSMALENYQYENQDVHMCSIGQQNGTGCMQYNGDSHCNVKSAEQGGGCFTVSEPSTGKGLISSRKNKFGKTTKTFEASAAECSMKPVSSAQQHRGNKAGKNVESKPSSQASTKTSVEKQKVDQVQSWEKTLNRVLDNSPLEKTAKLSRTGKGNRVQHYPPLEKTKTPSTSRRNRVQDNPHLQKTEKPSPSVRKNRDQDNPSSEVSPKATRLNRVHEDSAPQKVWKEKTRVHKNSAPRKERREKPLTKSTTSAPAVSKSPRPTSPVYHITWDGFDETCEPVKEICLLCGEDLYSAPMVDEMDEYYDDFVPSALPAAAVLPCGHSFHALCLEEVTPPDQSSDPPCFFCLSMLY